MHIQSISLISLLSFAILAAIKYIMYLRKSRYYKSSSYYQITKTQLYSLEYDLGKYGEYLIYEHLRHFEEIGGKFLFNILIPKGNATTTEIDVLLICPKGLLVFESKNFSGWIFGDDSKKNWTQTLPLGRKGICKERFYNPIMQNASHIKHLRTLVGENAPIFSIIVFSDRCTLMDITIKDCDVPVINRYEIEQVVSKIYDSAGSNVYTEVEIQDIYNKLYPLTQTACNI